MGCVASTIVKDEKVKICKERKKLMKQLLVFRGEFADGLFAYLRALRNTGATLRQFTESESLELENSTYSLGLPSSPPLPFPPSPPPPPSFSPDSRKFAGEEKEEVAPEESREVDEDDSGTQQSPVPRSSWEFWDPFGAFSPHCDENTETVEEEDWAETKSEFEEENEERQSEVIEYDGVNTDEKSDTLEFVDDNSSMMSCYTNGTNGTTDMTMVKWRSKKTLEAVVKELDDYFLKASAGAKEIAVLMDIDEGDASLPMAFKENKRRRSNSAKVFSALSWSWSSRSLSFSRDSLKHGNPGEARKSVAHCITLEKLYMEEKKLYKELKDEEVTKFEYERKSMLLHRQEDGGHEWSKIDKTRSTVENLQSDMVYLQESIIRTCSCILELIDQELHPQLIMLTSGLMHMWRTMYECHQVQNHISQQMNNLVDNQSTDPTTEYHRQAIAQLQTEVTSWYNSFCKVVKSQQDYVRTLSRWIQLTECLVDNQQQSGCWSAVRTICVEWLGTLDKISEKVAAEAINSFLSAIQSIVLQLTEEHSLQRKSDKLERRMLKEWQSLATMENKLDGTIDTGEAPSVLSPKHPLSAKRAKADALKKQVECEKAKYLNSIQVSRAMILNNLKRNLPNVFQALVVFSSACIQAFEALHKNAKPTGCEEKDHKT